MHATKSVQRSVTQELNTFGNNMKSEASLEILAQVKQMVGTCAS
jgi:hypothetical protein